MRKLEKTMRKLEKEMVNAVNGCRNWKGTNTRVICNDHGTFVVLYSTIIFARVNGREYYSDGGFKTATTASRLRALGADYSINAKKCACELTARQDMDLLYKFGQTASQRAENIRRICSEHDQKAAPIVANFK